MELVLVRTYYSDGTNGELYANGCLLCFTIELPWRDNLPKISCVPEGRYELKKRYSTRFGSHLLLVGVPGRSLILFHPANDALKELKGCIAPVSILNGEGKGDHSGRAFDKLLLLVVDALHKTTVFLTIKPKDNDVTTTGTGAHADVL